MKINSKILTITVFVILFGGILLTSAVGWWKTETTKEPIRISEGESAGEYDPADIRGSYTFGEISDLFGIPLDDLSTAFRVPVEIDAASFALKSLEALYVDLPEEIGTSSVRLFVALYKGLPYDLSDGSYLLPEAVAILQQQGLLDQLQEEYLVSHTIDLSVSSEILTEENDTLEPAATEPPEIETAATEHIAPDRTVTGETTFQDILDWGIDQSMIESVLGDAMPLSTTVVKDYCQQNGLTFSSIKSALQDELDQ